MGSGLDADVTISISDQVAATSGNSIIPDISHLLVASRNLVHY